MNVTSVNVGSLDPGSYTARVRADGDGVDACDSDWSADCAFTVGVCETLATPTVSGVGGASCGGTTSDTSPSLSWGDVANESGYSWEVRDSEDGLVNSGTTGAGVTTANLGELDPGSYTARVRADGDGENHCDSDWGTSCAFTVEEATCETDLAAPTVTGVGGVACGGTTDDASPSLSWSDVANESGYRWEVLDSTDTVVQTGTRRTSPGGT
jgi:hypothetical protein